MPSPFPLALAPPEAFSRVRSFLRESGYDDSTLCRIFKLDDMSDLGRVAWDQQDLAPLTPALRACIKVFLRGQPIPAAEFTSASSPEVADAFTILGLLRPHQTQHDHLVCPVWLYPADQFLIVSDRRDDPDGDPQFTPAADVVFPAIYAGTLRFLELLPELPGGTALDLCGGAGIGALHLARTAATAVSADLAERSARVTSFNALLNDIPIESLCGDLYAPVAGRTFDLISAHPPFVPALEDSMIYRDAGATGEEVTRRIIQGLPEFLRPNGTCVILCVGRDTADQPLERRVAEWLGPAATQFEIIFGLEKTLPVHEVVDQIRHRRERMDDATARKLHEHLQSLGTLKFVYGALVLRRHAAPVDVPPVRFPLAKTARAADFERLFAWRHWQRSPQAAARLPQLKPRLAPTLDLTVRHIMDDGQLVPAEFVFSTRTPFPGGLRIDGWVVPLIARFDGQRTPTDIYAEAKEELPADFGLSDFVALVSNLIEKGFLVVSDFDRPTA